MRPTTATHLQNYPTDIRLRLLPNMCKSTWHSQLSDDITSLTKIIKAQKPLTLKFAKYIYSNNLNRKGTLSIESVEQYLSSLDIALLDKSIPLADSIEEILALINAKDEKEAIGAMYQMIILFETLLNRIIQLSVIGLFNSGKNYPDLFKAMEGGIINDKPISNYFDSCSLGCIRACTINSTASFSFFEKSQ